MTQTAPFPFKLANLDAGPFGRPAIVVGDGIYPLQEADAAIGRSAETAGLRLGETNRQLIERYADTRSRLYEIAEALGRGEGPPAREADGVRFRPPILYPWNLVAVAVNYRAHGEEMERDIDEGYRKDPPYLFTKSPRACLIGTGDPLRLPPGREKIDWELELAAIIGTRATRVPVEQALEHVWGFGLILDISDREMLHRTNAFFNVDWFNAKTRDGFAPMGPYIVPAEFLPNHGDLHLELRVNGHIMQDYSTKYMNHNVAELVTAISSIQTLEPGDIIATGTPPGVGKARKPPIFLKAGDVITAEIEGICDIRTPVTGG